MKVKEGFTFYEIRGVRLAAVASGLKKDSLDLALFEFNENCVCSAVFTQSSFAAAPVLLSRAPRRRWRESLAAAGHRKRRTRAKLAPSS